MSACRSDRDNCSKVTIHSLHRTFGGVLLNDGHHIDAVADVLGHTSINTTRKHYAFSTTERRKATIHGFNRLTKPGGSRAPSAIRTRQD